MKFGFLLVRSYPGTCPGDYYDMLRTVRKIIELNIIMGQRNVP